MSIDQNPRPEPADTPRAGPTDDAQAEAADLGPHAPASPYPKPEKVPETGGYEAPPRPSGRES